MNNRVINVMVGYGVFAMCLGMSHAYSWFEFVFQPVVFIANALMLILLTIYGFVPIESIAKSEIQSNPSFTFEDFVKEANEQVSTRYLEWTAVLAAIYFMFYVLKWPVTTAFYLGVHVGVELCFRGRSDHKLSAIYRQLKINQFIREELE